VPTYRVYGAPVRDEVSGEVDPAMVGEQITIVTRGTTTPFAIQDGAGDPITGSNLTVQSAHVLPAFDFVSTSPAAVYLDWYHAASGKRGEIFFEEVLRELASGSVKSLNGQGPDEDGNVQFEVTGVDDTGLATLIETPASATALALKTLYGPGVLFLDLDDPVPPGTPDGTLIYRTAGGGTPPPTPVVYMTDDFERTVAAGSVGTPSGGGEYGAIDIAADWSVASGAGIWKAPAAGARSGYLRSSSYSQDTVEIVGMVSQVTGAVGNRIFTIAPRRISTSSVQYGMNIVLRGASATRPLQVDLGLQKGATEGDLQATVAGVLTTGALGDLVRFRMRVTQLDAATTQVQARVWLDGTTEPTTWQRDATDTTAALQGAGTLSLAVRQNSGETIGSEARIHEYTVQSVI
jgi:hypothetical protein